MVEFAQLMRRGLLALAMPALVLAGTASGAATMQQPVEAPAADRAAPHEQSWGLRANLTGTSWQHMNSQIVTYEWEVPGRVMIERDETNGETWRWVLQADGSLHRSHPDGRAAVSLVNSNGTETQYNIARTQRQTVRSLGPVMAYQFEYFADGQWNRFEPYDWFSWRMTDAQLEIARTALGTATNRSSAARELLARFRGRTTVEQGDARNEIHQEALRREQAATEAQAALPSAATPTNTATSAPTSTPAIAAAAAGRRIALVVGVSNYGAMGHLPNPVNDAQALSARLRQIGFDVELVTDPDQRGLRTAIQRLGARMDAAGASATGLFFFAGHGIQSRGENYLIPAGASIAREADIELEAVAASVVLRQMEEAESATNIMILDACRNMPLARSFRSGGIGLTQMDAPNGSFIAYSTAPGSVAADGAGANSPFAAALLTEIGEPGQPLEAVFRNVRRAVLQTTEGMQTPWDSSSLLNAFYFVPQ